MASARSPPMGSHAAAVLRWVMALHKALAYDGLLLIDVPVYYGVNPLGGMSVFGRWNVGNWCEQTQALRHSLGL